MTYNCRVSSRCCSRAPILEPKLTPFTRGPVNYNIMSPEISSRISAPGKVHEKAFRERQTLSKKQGLSEVQTNRL